MPEGVEVKLSADLIRPLVVGKTVQDVFVGDTSRYKHENPEGFDEFKKSLLRGEIKVEEVNVKGKFVYWKFSNGWYLMNTFGMSGQWSFAAGNHPCFFVEFQDGTEAVFNDPRHFGTIKLTSDQKELFKKLNELGWDPLAHGVDEKWINNVAHELSRTAKPIAQVLMDQKVFAGVGNYIRAEALYLVKMSPWRPCNLLKKEEVL
jgi:DNA-formamidopyrimidine glycosylase